MFCRFRRLDASRSTPGNRPGLALIASPATVGNLEGDRIALEMAGCIRRVDRGRRCNAGREGTPMLTIVPDLPAALAADGASSSLIDQIVQEGR